MAQKVTILLVDDVDGSDADETVAFALDGKSYEIDLTHENAEKLRDALAPWIGHARRLTGAPGRARRSSGGSTAGKADLKDVREWARANGHEVSERGRIPAAIQDAYNAAH